MDNSAGQEASIKHHKAGVIRSVGHGAGLFLDQPQRLRKRTARLADPYDLQALRLVENDKVALRLALLLTFRATHSLLLYSENMLT